jgi:glucose-6-phosphate isomerase
LIALFERAVGFYASLINVNAYHQPGVEAGKKADSAASAILDVQLKVHRFLGDHSGQAYSPEAIAERVGAKEQSEAAFKICEHLSANDDRNVEKTRSDSPRYGNIALSA